MGSGSSKPTTSIYSKVEGTEMDFTVSGTAIVKISNTPLAVSGTALTTIAGAVHNEDTAHVTADPGIQVLTVRQDDANKLSDADGDYAPLTTSEHGCLNVDPQHYLNLDACNATAGWSVLGDDTINLTTSLNHIFQTAALSFDKENGSDNTIFAGIQKTLTSFSANKHMEEGGGFLLYSIYVSSLSNVEYTWLRLGTDSSNYIEWQISVDNMVVGWNNIRDPLTRPDAYAGNGWDSSTITYIAVGLAFSNQINTLAGILIDALFVNSGLHVSADITAQVSSAVASPNVNVKKWGSKNVATDAGNASDGTLRVVVATDDTNLSVISGAVTSTTTAKQMQVDVVASLPTGSNAIGKLAANAGVTIGDVAVNNFPNQVWEHASGNKTGTGDQEILDTAGAGKYNYIRFLWVVNNDDEDMKMRLEEGDGTTMIDTLTLPAFGGQARFDFGGQGFRQPSANTHVDIDFVTSGASPDYTWFVEYATGA